MKFQIGSWNVKVDFHMGAAVSIEVVIDTDQPTLKATLDVSYWQGAEQPLVIKGDVRIIRPNA